MLQGRAGGAKTTARSHIFAILIFVTATIAATAAQHSEHPLTAAIVYLFGVVAVAALEGIRGGLAAAIVASVIYNFFLSDPAFRFSVSSAEDIVPLLAFNASAVASGVIAGRLKDRAKAAELATAQVSALLDLSTKLQSVMQAGEIPAATAGSLPELAGLYCLSANGPEPLASDHHRSLAEAAAESREPLVRRGNLAACRLESAGDLVGIAVFSGPVVSNSDYLKGVCGLLSVALERSALLERLEEAALVKKSEALKSALLSSVSHDLRTPLSVIAASASSLERYGADLSDEVKRDLLKTIQMQCGRLNRYTTNLLNLGRIQGGLDSTQFVECDMIEVLGLAISRTRAAAQDREITKRFDLESATIKADPVMLEQVFHNVLDNAVRYSAPGDPIEVAAFAEGDHAVVVVADRGVGVAEADMPHIFERFFRGRASARHEGSGLGLSIAKGFVEAFGGAIGADRRNDGPGTLMIISCPFTSQEAKPA
jgi:two-component system sensor histidine kinase KdpD